MRMKDVVWRGVSKPVRGSLIQHPFTLVIWSFFRYRGLQTTMSTPRSHDQKHEDTRYRFISDSFVKVC